MCAPLHYDQFRSAVTSEQKPGASCYIVLLVQTNYIQLAFGSVLFSAATYCCLLTADQLPSTDWMRAKWLLCAKCQLLRAELLSAACQVVNC